MLRFNRKQHTNGEKDPVLTGSQRNYPNDMSRELHDTVHRNLLKENQTVNLTSSRVELNRHVVGMS